MPACPTCNRALTDAALCRCGTDVGPLLQIDPRADHLYNLALDAHPAGDSGRALELLQANAVLAPFDGEARAFQPRLLLRLGRRDEAGTLGRLDRILRPAYQDLLDLEIAFDTARSEA